jgi:hypothetical protein
MSDEILKIEMFSSRQQFSSSKLETLKEKCLKQAKIGTQIVAEQKRHLKSSLNIFQP